MPILIAIGVVIFLFFYIKNATFRKGANTLTKDVGKGFFNSLKEQGEASKKRK